MTLKAVHDSIDEIPEEYQSLYTEKNGKFELTGIQGIRTQADLGRVQGALDHEKEEVKRLKSELGQWTQLGEYDEVTGNLDRIPELEAASKGTLDEAELDDLANKRADGIVKSRTAASDRENNKLKAQLAEQTEELTLLRTEKTRRKIGDEVQAQLIELKVRPEYHEDAMMWAQSQLAIDDDGVVRTKEDKLEVVDWLQGLVSRRPDWLTPSKGGGARGSQTGAGFGGGNPWHGDSWNVTKQGEVVKSKGIDFANKMAEAVGSKVGAARPTVKK